MKTSKTVSLLLPFLMIPLLLLSGCQTTPDPREDEAKVFYPPPPAPPRVQFLKSYSTSRDLEGKGSSFDKFLTGKEKTGQSLIKPYGVTIQDGKIYVCDSGTTVQVLDLKNRSFHRLEGAKGLGKVVQPLNINLDNQGRKYVADPIRAEVLMYDETDHYVKSFSNNGPWEPVDAVPFENNLYVVDTENRNIKVFDIESGKKTREMGQEEDLENTLGLPVNLAIDREGTLFISDAGRFQVVVYDRDGHELRTIGKAGDNLGHFARPRDITVDRNGLLYVVDAAFENVQIFRNDGQLLFWIGNNPQGERGKLSLPAGVAVDYDNMEYFQQYADPNFDIEHLILVTSQFGRDRLNVYGFGKQRGRQYPSEEELIERAQEKLDKWQREAGEEEEAEE